MIHAYDEIYLEKARASLARMLDFAVCEMNYDISVFFDLFIGTGVADLFESGDINTIAGQSGVELAYTILEKSGLSYERIETRFMVDRSPEYWTGWALAYYQWHSGLSFSYIVEHVPVTEILAMYDPYHEMDIRQFVDHMTDLTMSQEMLTNLKRFRMYARLSQNQLARETGIPVRTIQQYEQRQKNINKAGVDYVVVLAKVLGCDVRDLMEVNS